MALSQYSKVTDELLSAYIDGAVTSAERALVEDAAAHDQRIAWRLDSLRQTVSLLGQLTDVPLPRSFVLTESMLAESVPLADDRRAAPIFQPAREPSLWERWKRFWQSGNPLLRNAATVCAVLLVIVLVGDLSMTENETSSDALLRNNLASTSDMTQNRPAQAEVALLNSQTARPSAKPELAAAPMRSAADSSGNDQAEIAMAPSALRRSAMPSAIQAPIAEGTLDQADLAVAESTESDADESRSNEISGNEISGNEISGNEISSSETSPILAESVAEAPQTVEADEPLVGAAMMAVDAASLADEASTDESESAEGAGEASTSETREESVSDDADAVAMEPESSATARLQSEPQNNVEAVEVESPIVSTTNMSIESEVASETTINAAAPPTISPAPVALAQEQSENSVAAGNIARSNNSQPSVRLDAQQPAEDQSSDPPVGQIAIVSWLPWILSGLLLLFVLLWLRSRNRPVA